MKADIEDLREILKDAQQRAEAHRTALVESCDHRCDHPMEGVSAFAWRESHAIALQEEESLIESTTQELWVLVLEGSGKLDRPMSDSENILRLPPGAEEEDYWRARHEAAHVVVGIMLGRRLREVTIEANADHHPENRGSTVWIDDGPPPRNLDAVTTWAGVIAGPERAVAEGDLQRLEQIDALYDNFRWGALRLYRRFETTILEFAAELTRRRTMTGAEVVAWLQERVAGWQV